MKNTNAIEELKRRSDNLLDMCEAAKILRVTYQTVWAWCHNGTIGSCKIGRKRRIPTSEIYRIMQVNREPIEPERDPAELSAAEFRRMDQQARHELELLGITSR